MDRIKYTILIPCLNESETIKEAVLSAYSAGRKYIGKDFEILVADNGSTDNSRKIVKKLNKYARITDVPIRGYGAALHYGIKNARGKHVIFADADLSYPFENIKRFILLATREPDLVLGSRLGGRIENGAMPFLHRYVGTPILTSLIRFIYKIPTTDCNSGMRMVKKSFYEKLNMRCAGMEWASELLLKTAVRKGKYLEVPIIFKRDKRYKVPHLSTWADGWRHLKSIILLKPICLYSFFFIFLLLTFVSYLFKSFGFTFFFLELTVVLTLSLLVLDLLASVIESKPTKISKFLIQFKLVPITIAFSLFVGLAILFIPDTHLGTKLFLVSILGVIFMWIFLIETIKTHLINRLPDA